MNKSNKKYIYKICTITEWKQALLKGIYFGSEVDLRDKFIHFSTAQQVEQTLLIHFSRVNNLCLLKVSTEGLNIKWEKSRNKKKFPHLYNSLDVKKVIDVIILIKDNNSYNINSLKLE